MTDREAKQKITAALKEGGYIRSFDAKKRKKLSSQVYKKGYEARITCSSVRAAKETIKTLKQLGIAAGKPFEKGSSTMVPIYGKEQVETLAGMMPKKK